MDPDLIRLILIIFGVLLVAGIYLWDRYKRHEPRGPMVRSRARREPALVAPSGEPQTNDAADRDDVGNDAQVVDDVPASAGRDATASGGTSLDPEPVDLGDWTPVDDGREPQFTMDLNFDAHADGDYLHAAPALDDEIEHKLVVLHVMSRDGQIDGSALEKACDAVKLRHGEMSIYHFHDGATGQVLFSMANMVEPGNFPADDMAGFSTPGVTLFTQLPGARDGVEIFENMLNAGRRLAHFLQAELRDQERNKLTTQMEKHIVESLVEYRRRVRLARSRH
jgi:cell division protein ZipA